MNLLTIAFKSLRQRWLASSLTGLSVALGVSLMIAVLILNGVVAETFKNTGSGFDLILGPKGSQVQLVLSAIYHMDRPIENLPWRFFQQMSSDPRVERVIPVNIGDTTDVGNFPIVGTYPQYFALDVTPGKQFQVHKPGDFNRGTWDAVIGSHVARVNNWGIGTKFKLRHSGNDEHVHDEEFTVRGVLFPTGTPNDRTVFVHIDGFFQMSSHAKPVDEAIVREMQYFNETREQIEARYAVDLKEMAAHANESPEEHAHHHHGVSDLQKEVTAILVVAKSGTRPKYEEFGRDNNVMELTQELNGGFSKAMAANPVRVMTDISRNLVGNIQLAFLYLTGLIVAVSGIGIFVSIYNSMSDRRREIAIMRALGARRQTVLSIILLESVLLCVLGGLGGILLGHGLVFVASPVIEARSGLLIDPVAGSVWELVILPVLLVMAVLIGLLPGLTAYRTDVAQGLQGG